MDRDHIIQPGEVDFSAAVMVRVVTTRFVVPVPAMPGGGDAAVDPDTGLAILNKRGEQKRGLVFRNHTDKSWQVAEGDGSGVVVVNEVSPTDDSTILNARQEIIARRGDWCPSAVAALLGAITDMGYGDQFNSSRMEMVEMLRTKAGRHYDADGAGLYDRVGSPVEAVRILGSGRFQGPTVHSFDGDAVIIRHSANKVNLCQSDVFDRTYLTAGGLLITAEDLPVGLDIHASSARPMR